MTSKKKIIILLILLIMIAGGFILVKSKQKALQEEPTAYIYKHIPMSVVNEESKKNYELFTARLEAKQNPKITTKISGYIEKIYVKQNQQVKQGEILVSIDTNEYKASLEQMQYSVGAADADISALEKTVVSQKLDMQQALKSFTSNKKIFFAGGISKDQLNFSEIVYEQKKAKYLSTLDQIEAKKLSLKSQKALFKSKKSLQQYYTIYAPIDGVVEDLFLSQGDLTQGSKPILSLLSHTQKLTFTYINDQIKIGQEVYLKDKKIGFIGVVYPSAQRYLKVAEIVLDKPLELPYNSLLTIQVYAK